jgi:hypothetical protein
MRFILRKKSLVNSAYLLSAAIVFTMWVWGADTTYTSFNGDPRSTLSDLIYGNAHNPFVQRALVPFLTRTVYDLAPQTLWSGLTEQLLTVPKIQKEIVRLRWEPRFLPEYLIALTFTFLSLVGFVFIVRSLWSSLYDTQDEITNAVPLFALACLPLFFHVGTHYIYDFPALFFFTLGVLCMVRLNWTAFYPVYIVGCLNKETMVILSLGFLLVFFHRMKSAMLLKHVVIQLLLFATIKIFLLDQFAGNPGGVLELHLFGNLHNILLGYSVSTLLIGAAIGILVWYDLKEKHFALRRLSWLLIPFGMVMLFFGWISEVRVLYEIFPVYLFLALHTVFFSFLKFPLQMKPILSSRSPTQPMTQRGQGI